MELFWVRFLLTPENRAKEKYQLVFSTPKHFKICRSSFSSPIFFLLVFNCFHYSKAKSFALLPTRKFYNAYTWDVDTVTPSAFKPYVENSKIFVLLLILFAATCIRIIASIQG